MVEEINIIEIQYLKNEIQEEINSEHTFGFLLGIGKNENGVNLNIDFELKVPVTNGSCVFSKTSTRFFLHHFDFDYLRNEINTIAELVLASMCHTRMHLLSKYKKLNPELKVFKSEHFISEIKRQMGIQ